MATSDKGYVQTPSEVAMFMARLVGVPNRPLVVLDPAAGDGRLLEAFHFCNRDIKHRLVAVELDPERAGQIPRFVDEVHCRDFLLWTPETLYDVVLMNPPYGIVGVSSKYPMSYCLAYKDQYRRRCATWTGKYNLYGAFLETAVRWLRPGGVMVAIVPASWMVLDDYAQLRRFLSDSGQLDVFYVGSVFPGRNVNATVLRMAKGVQPRRLRVYAMTGRLDGDLPEPVTDLSDWVGEMVRFHEAEARLFEWSGTPIGQIFEVRFAARSTEFRKSGLVRLEPQPGDVPVLTGRNLEAGRIDYDTCHSGWWMKKDDARLIRSFYARPHLVVGHTKGTRMVAAVDWRCYPWREEYHLTPLTGIHVDYDRVASYLNSDDVQQYLRNTYADIVPHLTRSMLMRIPVPNIESYFRTMD